LAEAGIQIWDWPHILLALPYAKGKGMQRMGSTNLMVIINAFRNNEMQAEAVGEEGKIAGFFSDSCANHFHFTADRKKMQNGEIPVIIGQAPPSDAPQERGYRVFHDTSGPRHDEGGPQRRKKSKAPSSSGARRRAVVVMASPTKSNRQLYKSREFGRSQSSLRQ
jgi:hypothetical protein